MKVLRKYHAGAAARRLGFAAVLAFGTSIQAGAADPGSPPGAISPEVPAADEPAQGATAAGEGAVGATPGASPAIERVRAAQEAAEKRRDVLLQPDAAVADPAIRKALLEKWGVEVFGVRLAARGYMIDFRFKVIDVDKALPLFDTRIKPYLLPDGSTIKLPVPVGQKVGAFRTTNRGKNILADKIYAIMFANPDSFVKLGQKVSVVIGDFRVEHLTLK
jgi:hypothetical protein